MTNHFYRTGIDKVDHTTFGGKIYSSDFERKITLTEIAAKIAADKRFDQQCMKNIELKKNRRGAV